MTNPYAVRLLVSQSFLSSCPELGKSVRAVPRQNDKSPSGENDSPLQKLLTVIVVTKPTELRMRYHLLNEDVHRLNMHRKQLVNLRIFPILNLILLASIRILDLLNVYVQTSAQWGLVDSFINTPYRDDNKPLPQVSTTATNDLSPS